MDRALHNKWWSPNKQPPANERPFPFVLIAEKQSRRFDEFQFLQRLELLEPLERLELTVFR